jgi:hypothetical protein
MSPVTEQIETVRLMDALYTIKGSPHQLGTVAQSVG